MEEKIDVFVVGYASRTGGGVGGFNWYRLREDALEGLKINVGLDPESRLAFVLRPIGVPKAIVGEGAEAVTRYLDMEAIHLWEPTIEIDEEADESDGTEPSPVTRSLLVMLLDEKIRAFLMDNDPKAFAQALRACKADADIPADMQATLSEFAEELAQRDAPSPIDRLVDTVTIAIQAYDKTNDHTGGGKGHYGDDCIRCKMVAALPPYAQAKVKA